MFNKSRFLKLFFSVLTGLQCLFLLAFYAPLTGRVFAPNLSNADLRGVNLSFVNLRWADLTGALLDGTNLCGADLRNTIGLTRAQLSVANLDERTILPDYLRKSENKIAEKPIALDRTPDEQLQADPNWIDRSTPDNIIIELSSDILFFDFNRSDIRSDAVPTLEKLAKVIKNSGSSVIQLNGYTDSIGTDEYDVSLSERRAQSVKRWLSKKGGISVDRLLTKGFGKNLPVAPNTNEDGSDNPAGRKKNRRVEIIIPRNKSTA